MNANGTINIVKFLNFPIENNATEEIEINLQLDEKICAYRLAENINISELVNNKKVYHNKKYFCQNLFVIDEQGEKYTLLGCSFWCRVKGFTTYIDFTFDGILFYGHINNIDDILLDKVELKINYKRPLCFNFTNNGINVVSTPVYSKEHLTKEELEWFGKDHPGEYQNAIDLILTGNNTFCEYEKFIWRLSEFVLLRHEDMFFYDTFILYCNKRQYKYKNFKRSNNTDLRKKNLKTSKNRINIFCADPLDDFEMLFKKFLDFREKSGIVFDVFRSTVYSNSFREDYPLRLSQTMEGLANYLEIIHTANVDTDDNFRKAILYSIRCNDYLEEYLPNKTTRKSFCYRITEHRNCLSHVNKDKQLLQGEKNEEYAEILYSTIRVLIIKHLKGEI